jgi:hypothetical protein|tara:strand:- start:22 stop:864 length:843 start_codon:yes stop_codon:yes gene_type:complete
MIKNKYIIIFIILVLTLILIYLYKPTYTIRISKWYGRLGNNIVQVNNAIQIGLYYNYNIILPKHPYFNTTYININNRMDSEVIMEDIFFNNNNLYMSLDITKDLFNLNIEETRDILKKIFIIKDIKPLEDDTLIIHIRSGDIFTGTPAPLYINPPLSYYVDIINNNSFNNIYIISEDKQNPIIDRLLNKYHNIIFKVSPLEEDIKIILSAKNIVYSVGTFIPSLISLSDNIRIVYKPSYEKYKILCNENVIIHTVDLDEYWDRLYPWLNTKEQVLSMLNY